MPLSLEEKVRLLSMVDVFEQLSREEMEKLAHLATDTIYEKGRICARAREAAASFTCSRRGVSSST